MIRRRVHAFSGFEFDWLACDEEGFVAMFSSAGFGPVPEAALAIADSLTRLSITSKRCPSQETRHQ